MRALYVSPMVYGANQAVDAISHGLEAELDAHGIDMRVAYADFDEPDWKQQADRAVRAGADAGYEAIVVWVIDPDVPADAVAYARAKGVRVVSFERPRYPVEASVVYPNFNQGVYMMEHLATLLPPGGRVAVVGGPDVIDDIELLAGIRHGLDSTGLVRVNDPEDPRYKNTTAPAELPWPTSVAVPPYPPNALGSGKVVLEADLSDRGAVTKTRILTPPSPFDSAAADTARQWQFRPASRGNRDVASRAFLVFSFVGTTP